MKRPLAVFCFTWYAVQLVCTRLPQSGLLTAAVFLLLSFLIMVAAKTVYKNSFSAKTVFVFLTAALCAVTLQSAYRVKTVNLEKQWAYTTRQIKATVQEVSLTKNGAALQLRYDDGKEKFLFTTWLPVECEKGDSIIANLDFVPASLQDQIKGNRLSAEYSSDSQMLPEVIPGETKELLLLQRLQNRLSGVLQAFISQDAGKTAAAVCVGDKDSLPDTLYRNYRRAGISHLLAVSGMHLSVVCGFLMFGKKRPKLRLFLGFLLVGSYAALTGGSSSVLRAAVMLLLVLAGPAVGRKADAITSLGVAAACLTFPNPMAAANTGLLLSVSATAGVIAAAGKSDKYLTSDGGKTKVKRLAFSAVRLGIVSFGATLATLPAQVLTGGYISLWSVPASMLTVPVLPLVLFFGLVGGGLELLGLRWIGTLLLTFCGMTASYLNAVAKFFSNFSFGGGFLQNGCLQMIVVVAAMGAAALLFLREKRKFALVLTCILSVSLLLLGVLERNTVKTVLIGTPTAPAVVIAKQNTAAVLWAGGSNTDKLERCLERMNITKLVLLCDFSSEKAQKPQLTYYIPETYCKLEESVTTGVTFRPFDGIILSIEKQQEGSWCRMDLKGVQMAYSVGKPNLGTQEFSVVFCGKTTPSEFQSEYLLTTDPQLSKIPDAMIGLQQYAQGMGAFVREGMSYKITEVNTGGGTK